MKKNILFGLIIGIIILVISSCSIFGVGTTMSDRIGYFEDDLNGSRTNIIDNVHPDAPGYNTADNDGYWSIVASTWDPASKQFSIKNISEGSSSATATFYSGDYSGGVSVSFDMKDDGDFFSGEDWKIMSCDVDGVSQF